jgi:hypothetical protein
VLTMPLAQQPTPHSGGSNQFHRQLGDELVTDF